MDERKLAFYNVHSRSWYDPGSRAFDANDPRYCEETIWKAIPNIVALIRNDDLIPIAEGADFNAALLQHEKSQYRRANPHMKHRWLRSYADDLFEIMRAYPDCHYVLVEMLTDYQRDFVSGQAHIPNNGRYAAIKPHNVELAVLMGCRLVRPEDTGEI